MLSINEIMTADLFTLQVQDTLADAVQLMREHRIRHVPVVDDSGELLGLITQRDLLTANSACTSIDDIMRKEVYTVSEDDDMRSAALILQKYKIGSLPVTSNGKLVGIVTDSDYVGLAINLLEQMEEVEPDDFDDYDSTDALSG